MTFVGALLTLVTWLVALVAVLVLGLPWVVGRGRRASQRLDLRGLRLSLWLGLGVLVLLILVVNLLVPLRSAAAAAAVALALVASGVVLVVMWPGLGFTLTASRGPALLVSLMSVAAVGFFAMVATGPLTNYDSGLYHIGAVLYAGDFATIPGLANVYQALGYNNSQFPFAAAFTNGPWGIEGMRLANGVLILLLLVDLTLRWWSRHRGRGTWVMLVASVCLLVPMIGLADYWVTSPTSDSAVFVLSIVAATYLVDILASPRADARGPMAVIIVTSVLIVAMRPTMGLYAVLVVAIGLTVLISCRRPASRWASRTLLFSALVAAALIVVQVVRDRVLSGWLMYPLSIFPFDVPWRALDPVNTRLSTLGVARDPDNYLEATQGWGWVGPWVSRLPSSWEFFAWCSLLLFVLVLMVVRRGQGARGLWNTRLAVAMLPSGVAVLAWWALSPPSFRFIWGPMFVLLAVPSGWLLYGIATRAKDARDVGVMATALALVVVGGVAAYSLLFRVEWSAWTEQRVFRLGPVEVGYTSAPVVLAPTERVPMPSGLELLRPVQSDQCWMTYPLCTPLIEAEVVPLGNLANYPEDISEGFLHRQ